VTKHRSTAHQPLLEFVYLGCPAYDLSENRPLPGVVSDPLRPAPATAPTRSVHVVSHHLNGLLRFRPQVCCNSIPHRVRCVSPLNLLHTTRPKPRQSRRLAHPHNAVHTPQRIPLASSRTVSPRPLPLLSFAYATGLFTPPPLQSFPNNDEDKKRHLPERRPPKRAALACRQPLHRASEDLVTRECRCAPGRRSIPNQHRNDGLSRSTSGLYSTDESVLCGLFPVPPQPILPWALFPSKVPLFPIHAHHLTATETRAKAKASRATLHPSFGFAH